MSENGLVRASESGSANTKHKVAATENDITACKSEQLHGDDQEPLPSSA